MNRKKAKTGLGVRLSEIRRRNGWTLAEVSRMTGLAVSTLSKVENDQMSLTYDNIIKLAEGLGTDVAEFFSHRRPLRVSARRSVTRAPDERHLETENYLYRYHATDLRDASMIPMVVEIRAGKIEEFGELMSHSGEEFIFVLEGRIEVHTEFYEPVTLGPGESIYLDSTMAHGYLCASGGTARILGVCSSPSTSLRERARRQ